MKAKNQWLNDDRRLILDDLKWNDRLDFSVWDIVTVIEWEYVWIGVKLIKIKEDWVCILRVSPDNDIEIEIYFDKVKSIASFVESYARVTRQAVWWVLWWINRH